MRSSTRCLFGRASWKTRIEVRSEGRIKGCTCGQLELNPIWGPLGGTFQSYPIQRMRWLSSWRLLPGVVNHTLSPAHPTCGIHGRSEVWQPEKVLRQRDAEAVVRLWGLILGNGKSCWTMGGALGASAPQTLTHFILPKPFEVGACPLLPERTQSRRVRRGLCCSHPVSIGPLFWQQPSPPAFPLRNIPSPISVSQPKSLTPGIRGWTKLTW